VFSFMINEAPLKIKDHHYKPGSGGLQGPASSAENDRLVRQLRQRVKELDCIYAICHLASDPTAPFDQIIKDIVDRIPTAFRKPKLTCAGITIGDKVTRTANFTNCRWKLEKDITAYGKTFGKVEVGYPGDPPDEGAPFLEEEKKFLQSIANRLGIVAHAKFLKDSLAESEKLYHSLVDNAIAGICRTTLTGEVLYANSTCLHMFGYESLEEGKAAGSLNHYRNQEDRKKIMTLLQENGRIAGLEVEAVTKTGEPIHVLFSATLEAGVITAMILDISERKLAHDCLIINEKRLTEAQRIGQLGSWEWDISNGTVYWSDQMVEIFGAHPREFDATHEQFLQFVHPDDRQAVREMVEKSLSCSGEACWFIEHRIIRLDGCERVVHLRGEVTFDENRRPFRMFGTVHDITERKQKEKELQRAFDEIKTLKEKLEAENIYLRDEMELKDGCGGIIGTSDAIKYVIYRTRVVARTKASVLLTGETGTGKNLFARFIHLESDRRDKPFINVNCAGLPANLIESELFGREKGAFTGSTARQIGRFELANNGTIFLDEIGELPLELQVKLLKVIDTGEFERLGSPHTVKVNVRIIASTNRNLEVEMKKGRFRQDFFFRLSVFPLTIPPLRQRKGDIPLLVTHFTNKFRKAYHKNIERIPMETMEAFTRYAWPGNVRELINIIERAVIMSDGPELHLAEPIGSPFAAQPQHIKTTEGRGAGSIKDLAEVEKEHIQRTLRSTGWRIEGPQGAARILGMNPSTMRARMRKLRISRENFEKRT
jgi:formate hydrogenlyase transcriptional activator